MTSALFLQLVVNALQSAAVYALVALGLTMVFSIMGIINFAHGELYMLAGFVTYFLFDQYLVSELQLNIYVSYALTFVVALVVIGAFGYVLEKSLFRPFRGELLPGLIVSFGLVMVLQMGTALTVGAVDRKVFSVFPGVVRFFGAALSLDRIFIMLAGVALIAGLHFFITRTKIGLAIRAIVQNRESAELYGIDYGAMSSFGFALGAALAAAAGVLVVPATFVSPWVGHAYIGKAFVVIIIGGLGSIPGVLLAGLVLGIIESFGSYFFSLPAAMLVSFLLMIAILLIRPQGFLGRAER